ncbi:MAG: hypothetical protein ACM65M_26045 [Microcoleus sp.]
MIINVGDGLLRHCQRDRHRESSSIMVVILVPPEAHGKIDCIALSYRQIAIEPFLWVDCRFGMALKTLHS